MRPRTVMVVEGFKVLLLLLQLLTRRLRNHGAQNGCILALAMGEKVTAAVVERAVAAAKAAPSMSGLDLAAVSSRSRLLSLRERIIWQSERMGWKLSLWRSMMRLKGLLSDSTDLLL